MSFYHFLVLEVNKQGFIYSEHLVKVVEYSSDKVNISSSVVRRGFAQFVPLHMSCCFLICCFIITAEHCISWMCCTNVAQ